MFKTDYRHQHTPTDITRHSQTLQDITREVAGSVWGCLVLSWGVLCCLGVDRKMLRAVWDAFMGVSLSQVLVWVWDVILRDRAWVEQLYHDCTTPNNKICFTWLYWDIKISKCLYISLKKMVEFCNLLIFWCPSERNYKIQLYYITL